MGAVIKQYFVQDPQDKFDYDFDFSDIPASDPVQSATVTITPSTGLTNASPTISGQIVKVWITVDSIAYAGKDFQVECQVITQLGRKVTGYAVIQVRQP